MGGWAQGSKVRSRPTYVQGDGQTDGRPQRVTTSHPLRSSKRHVTQPVRQPVNRQSWLVQVTCCVAIATRWQKNPKKTTINLHPRTQTCSPCRCRNPRLWPEGTGADGLVHVSGLHGRAHVHSVKDLPRWWTEPRSAWPRPTSAETRTPRISGVHVGAHVGVHGGTHVSGRLQEPVLG